MSEVQVNNGVVHIKGDIHFDSASRCYADALKHFNSGAPLTINLSEIGDLDSSALAVMLAWLREAKKRNIDLSYADFPPAIQKLISLCELGDIFR